MDRKAANSFARKYTPLVRHIVATEQKKIGADPALRDDLRSFAMEGLAGALCRFSSSRGARFETFAAPRIRGSIYDGLRQLGWFPRQLWREISYYRRGPETKYGGEGAASVAQQGRYGNRLREQRTAYIELCGDPNDNTFGSTPPIAEIAVDQKLMVNKLRHYMDTLSDKQRAVVYGHFFEGLNCSQIAKRMGVTRSWVCRLRIAALNSLAQLVEGQSVLLGQK